MKIEIDPKKGMPIYLQIIEQIKHKIASGELSIGDRIPTVRKLAVDLEINPNTVAKAYNELEREGILDSKQGIGTFVKKNKNILTIEDRKDKLTELCRKFLDEALWFGFNKEDIMDELNRMISSKR
ncbi:GntR family transcriptional regulator [candidate division KSB1 bacterium]|nr:MAG: GntR family transcriptional regulator [candidate division KSB1 bacterium]